MTHKPGFLNACTFSLNISGKIPDDTILLQPASNCIIEKAELLTILAHADGSCYAEVSINYHSKTMIVTLTGVNSVSSMVSPYDDMFGFANAMRSVIQYKINGNLEEGKVEMITRIQCKTNDNCALNTLRNLLPKLTTTETRWNIFKQTASLLNTQDTDQGAKLSCMNVNEEDTECSDGEDRCKFDRKKNKEVEKSCVPRDNHLKYDIEYRFNVIEEQADYGADTSGKTFKFLYFCKSNLCNNNDNVQRVDKLLYSFALSLSIDQNTDTKPAAQENEKNPPNKKSDGVSLTISFYSGLIVVFLFLI